MMPLPKACQADSYVWSFGQTTWNEEPAVCHPPTAYNSLINWQHTTWERCSLDSAWFSTIAAWGYHQTWATHLRSNPNLRCLLLVPIPTVLLETLPSLWWWDQGPPCPLALWQQIQKLLTVSDSNPQPSPQSTSDELQRSESASARTVSIFHSRTNRWNGLPQVPPCEDTSHWCFLLQSRSSPAHLGLLASEHINF